MRQGMRSVGSWLRFLGEESFEPAVAECFWQAWFDPSGDQGGIGAQHSNHAMGQAQCAGCDRRSIGSSGCHPQAAQHIVAVAGRNQPEIECRLQCEAWAFDTHRRVE